jgi:hypothetical protein
MQSGRQNTNGGELERSGINWFRRQAYTKFTCSYRGGDNKWLSFLGFEWFCLLWSLMNFNLLLKHHIDSEVSRVIWLMLKIDLKLIESNYFLNLSCNFHCSFLKIILVSILNLKYKKVNKTNSRN